MLAVYTRIPTEDGSVKAIHTHTRTHACTHRCTNVTAVSTVVQNLQNFSDFKRYKHRNDVIQEIQHLKPYTLYRSTERKIRKG